MRAVGSSSTGSRATSFRPRSSTRCSTTIGRPLDAVLFFDLDDETAAARALGRAYEEGRADDTPEVVARRLAIYHEQTEPVVERYRAAGTLHTLAAHRAVDDVFAEIEDALRTVDS